ncbi:hypothetical protein C9374_003312 [Naegleria lovaniensis]|uniref:Uncharacterized protein n=1 Tax=Naegleria lovaniensis TaxID=51637 RepID=A0AA88KPK3_NAELO|nr:uncharacterized protein C9374_003312 [Naegleria lovaniensis]KAG2385497.1 hypothetical protein C9374_003312 [Naegleria lovaniensis]
MGCHLLPNECRTLVDYIIKIRLGRLSSCSSTCWQRMKEIYFKYIVPLTTKSKRMRRISWILVTLVAFSASGYVFIKLILLFFSNSLKSVLSPASIEELDAGNNFHGNSSSLEEQQDPLYCPNHCIMFLDRVKEHVQTSLMNQFSYSEEPGIPSWTNNSQHLRVVVCVVQVFCLANIVSRVLSCCFLDKRVINEKVLDQVEHVFSEKVIPTCIQQQLIKKVNEKDYHPSLIDNFKTPLHAHTITQYLSTLNHGIMMGNHLEDVLRSIRIENEKIPFSPCSLLLNSITNQVGFSAPWSQRIEEIWLQYCNACFDLLVSHVRNSTSAVLIKGELDKMLATSTRRSGTTSLPYEELLDDLSCFAKLDLELNI